MTLDQVYDELYGEIDQIKNELKNTLAQIQYASNFTEGISLGTLSVGAESSQVIAPHVSLLPGAESGMMVLDLPVGTESAMLPVQIQDDPEATELVDDAIPTGKTMESYLNSNFAPKFTKVFEVAGDGTKTFGVCFKAIADYIASNNLTDDLRTMKKECVVLYQTATNNTYILTLNRYLSATNVWNFDWPMTMSATNYNIGQSHMSSTAENNKYYSASTNNAGVTSVNEKSGDTLPSGAYLQLYVR